MDALANLENSDSDDPVQAPVPVVKAPAPVVKAPKTKKVKSILKKRKP